MLLLSTKNGRPQSSLHLFLALCIRRRHIKRWIGATAADAGCNHGENAIASGVHSSSVTLLDTLLAAAPPIACQMNLAAQKRASQYLGRSILCLVTYFKVGSTRPLTPFAYCALMTLYPVSPAPRGCACAWLNGMSALVFSSPSITNRGECRCRRAAAASIDVLPLRPRE